MSDDDELKAIEARLRTTRAWVASPDGAVWDSLADIPNLVADVRRLEVAKNQAYFERNQCVRMMAKMAKSLGLRCGLGRHNENDANWERDWLNIVFIDFPSGQCSWHIHDSERPMFAFLPTYQKPWDGHSTEEKYRRMGVLSVTDLRDESR